MKCSNCRDEILYCRCEREDPTWSNRAWLSENPTYWIYLADMSAEWDREGRALFGSESLVREIKRKLSGKLETVLYPDFQLLMVEQDPYAVHFVAQLIPGCTFSKSAPDWSELSVEGRVY